MILAALVLAQAPVYAADRFAMGVRLTALDTAWTSRSASRERKEAATPKVDAAVQAFFMSAFGRASRALDEATLLLEPRARVRPFDLEILPRLAEAGTPSVLSVTWAYSGEPTTIEVEGARVPLTPGVPLRIPLRSSERDERLRLRVDGLQLGASRPRNLEARLAALEAQGGWSRSTAQLLREQNRSRGELSLGDRSTAILRDAEAGFRRGRGAFDLFRAQQGSTVLRAFVPGGTPKGLVIAVHGAGGSENLFFEGYGRGRAVELARERGWILIAPRAGNTAVRDAYEFAVQQLGYGAGSVFLMGHSMGGGIVLGTAASLPARPDGVALFAPAARGAANLRGIPTFLAVGKQEMAMLRNGAWQLRDALADAPGFQFVEKDPSEHLMIVAEALPEAYRFFDRQARARR